MANPPHQVLLVLYPVTALRMTQMVSWLGQGLNLLTKFLGLNPKVTRGQKDLEDPTRYHAMVPQVKSLIQNGTGPAMFPEKETEV